MNPCRENIGHEFLEKVLIDKAKAEILIKEFKIEVEKHDPRLLVYLRTFTCGDQDCPRCDGSGGERTLDDSGACCNYCGGQGNFTQRMDIEGYFTEIYRELLKGNFEIYSRIYLQ